MTDEIRALAQEMRVGAFMSEDPHVRRVIGNWAHRVEQLGVRPVTVSYEYRAECELTSGPYLTVWQDPRELAHVLSYLGKQGLLLRVVRLEESRFEVPVERRSGLWDIYRQASVLDEWTDEEAQP